MKQMQLNRLSDTATCVALFFKNLFRDYAKPIKIILIVGIVIVFAILMLIPSTLHNPQIKLPEDIDEPSYVKPDTNFNRHDQSSLIDPDLTFQLTDKLRYYSENEALIVAKILYRECRGIPSITEQACVIWTMCNRVDAGYGVSILQVATEPGQYAWYEDTPVWQELYELAKDVLDRWSLEKLGFENVGRVLPEDYLWFRGDGKHNHFRNQYKGGAIWDYSLASPYET